MLHRAEMVRNYQKR